MYELMGKIHASIYSMWNDRSGQGTVEYIALIALVGVIVAGAIATLKGDNNIGNTLLGKLKDAISTADSPK